MTTCNWANAVRQHHVAHASSSCGSIESDDASGSRTSELLLVVVVVAVDNLGPAWGLTYAAAAFFWVLFFFWVPSKHMF